MSYYDKLNRFRVKITQSPKSVILTSVNRFKKLPKNRIKAILRKDGKITVTTDYDKYKKVKEKFGELLTGAKYESENSGKDSKTKSGGNNSSGTTGSNGGPKKKGFGAAVASVLDSARGRQSS